MPKKKKGKVHRKRVIKEGKKDVGSWTKKKGNSLRKTGK